MFLRFLFSILFLITSGHQAIASPTAEEIEAAYKQGLDAWDKGDPITAMQPLKKASDGGNAEAQALLAYILDVADEDDQAAIYYKKAADQGNFDGMFGLASFHLGGDGGVKVDIVTARDLYVRAAEAGHVPSISVLVIAHINGGLGFTEKERNGASALKWFTRGAEANLPTAIEQLMVANRQGKYGLPINIAEAERLQAKYYELQGIDPSQVKKKRQRR